MEVQVPAAVNVDDVDQLAAMFPQIDNEVLVLMLETSSGGIEEATGRLLTLCNESDSDNEPEEDELQRSYAMRKSGSSAISVSCIQPAGRGGQPSSSVARLSSPTKLHALKEKLKARKEKMHRPQRTETGDDRPTSPSIRVVTHESFSPQRQECACQAGGATDLSSPWLRMSQTAPALISSIAAISHAASKSCL